MADGYVRATEEEVAAVEMVVTQAAMEAQRQGFLAVAVLVVRPDGGVHGTIAGADPRALERLSAEGAEVFNSLCRDVGTPRVKHVTRRLPTDT
jgi:hypothetical protein